MRTKMFYAILSNIIAIPFGFTVYVLYVNYPFADPFIIFPLFMGIFTGIPATILTIIHKLQNKKQKQRNGEKNNTKEILQKESKDDKTLLGMIQERLAKGEISVQEFQELKKEISS